MPENVETTKYERRIGEGLSNPQRFDEVPVRDARDHLASAKPNTNQPPPPDKDERARGVVKPRGG
jgi:hypothetical protein